jgi:hypothetical protein
MMLNRKLFLREETLVAGRPSHSWLSSLAARAHSTDLCDSFKAVPTGLGSWFLRSFYHKVAPLGLNNCLVFLID